MSEFSYMDKERVSLCDALDRVLNKGVVVVAEISISVANVDLIYISLQALITSVETARQLQNTESPIPVFHADKEPEQT